MFSYLVETLKGVYKMTEKQRQKLVAIGKRSIAKQEKQNKKNVAKYKPGMFSTGAVLGEGASSMGANIALGLLGVPVDAYGVGGLAGYATRDVDPNTVKNYSALSLIPGVGGYRGVKRTQLVDQHYSKGKRRNSADASEKFGGLTSTLALMAIGAIGGGALGGIATENLGGVGLGAGLGAVAGLGSGALGNVAGLALGLLEPRTPKEHKNYLADKNLVSKNLLIPGYAGWHRGKRLRSMLSGTI